MTTPEQPLLPCPFCGEIGTLRQLYKNAWEVHCETSRDCHVRPTAYEKTSDAVIAAWNTRHQPTDQQIDQAAHAYSLDFSDWDDTRGAAYSGFEAGVKWVLGLSK